MNVNNVFLDFQSHSYWPFVIIIIRIDFVYTYCTCIIVFIKRSHNSFNLIDVVYSINTDVNMKGYYQFK